MRGTVYLIIGAGRQGTACGAFLLERFGDARVLFADRDEQRLAAAMTVQRDPSRVETRTCDIAEAASTTTTPGAADGDGLDRLIAECDCVISCVPFVFNESLTRRAIRAGKPFCDMGGNIDTVRRQRALADDARRAGVTIVPDCGLAPGMLNVLAESWHDRWTYRSVKLLCGGLPQQPRGPLAYAQFFSPLGLLNEYLEDVEVARNTALLTIPGLSEPETIADLPLPGEFEAFATSGGASLASELYAPQGIDYDYKTLRYRGHRDVIQAMWDLGFFDLQPREVADVQGRSVRIDPRAWAARVLADGLDVDRRDVVIARAIVEGTCDGKPATGRVDLLDHADERFTAMERTTGFSTAVLAAFITGRYGPPPPPGVSVPFQILPPPLLIDELARAGVNGITLDPRPGS